VVTTGALRPPPLAGSTVGPVPIALGAGAAGLAAVSAVTIGPGALALPLVAVGALLLVREPLALLTLYLYVGLFKEQAIISAAPFDVTVALGLLLGGVCLARWVSGRMRPIPFGLATPLVVLGLLLVVSLTWTPSPEYGTEKAVRFLTLTMLATVAPFFLIEDQRDLRRLFAWTVAIAVLAAALTLLAPAQGERLTLGTEGNTIGLSHLLCTGVVILLIGTLTDLVPARGWALLGSAALLGVAAAIGSRGPLLSLVLALALTGAVFLARVPRRAAPVMVAVIAGVALLPFISLPEGASDRLSRAASDPVQVLRDDPRYTTFGQALRLIEDQPLIGIGAGGFQSVGRIAVPPEDYPHNMFLEVWSELGLAALLVLAGSVIAVLAGMWRGAWSVSHGPEFGLLYVLIGVFLFNLLAVQLTGDLIQNRTFWGAFGLAWLVVQYGIPEAARRR
jgi:O-antigen ligase